MNPTDAYRKELRKKELKRNKKERKKVREVGILKKDPEALKEQIDKLEMMKADGALDKARKHKKRQLEDTLKLVLKKRKEYEEKLREKGETPMFSHLGPVRRRSEEESAKHPKPEDSVYYHPTLNPTGAPPPGKPPMYKSTIGPRIPLGASSSAAASSSKAELDEENLDVLTPTDLAPAEDSERQKSPPIPLETPEIPKAHVELNSMAPGLPLPPPPPPLPGPPKEQVGVQSLRPLPPPPPPPSIGHLERGSQQNRISGDCGFGESINAAGRLPPPPPPPGLPVTQANQNPESGKPDSAATSDFSKLTSLPPLPPRLPPPPPPPRHLTVHAMQPDVALLDRIPPPPDMRPTLPVPGLPNRPPPPPPPPGILPPTISRPFPMPPGVPPMPPVPIMNMTRPPLPPGFPDNDHAFPRPSAPASLKPSYVKSAASTVVKRPLAQHTPELTAMVPASVRVKRESAIPKLKSKTQHAKVSSAPHPSPSVIVGRSEPAAAAPASKPQNIDDSYMAFLEDMKALGALDS